MIAMAFTADDAQQAGKKDKGSVTWSKRARMYLAEAIRMDTLQRGMDEATTEYEQPDCMIGRMQIYRDDICGDLEFTLAEYARCR